MIVAAVVVGFFLLFAMPLIEPLPKAALGVIIVVAAAGLINVRSIWRLRHVRPAEVGLALVAFGGVLVFGVLGGVAVAIALSIGVFLYRAARPHDAVLGRSRRRRRLPRRRASRRCRDGPGPPRLPLRRAAVLRQRRVPPPRVLELADALGRLEWLVLNAEAWMFLDATAIDVLAQLQDELEATRHRARLRAPEGTAARDLRRNRPDGADRRRPLLPDSARRSRRLRGPNRLRVMRAETEL